jgi:photosystem II stability/assembly factor-like uncharacterized protein
LGLANLGISALAIDPQSPDTLYVAGGVKDLSRGGQIFKSTDGGANWNPAGVGLPSGSYVYSLVIHPGNPAMLYALMYRSSSTGAKDSYDYLLATSTDGAASWTLVIDPIVASANPITILPDPQDAGTLYLGTVNGVLKTTDTGGHWNFVNSGLRAAPIDSLVIDSQTTRPRAGAALFAVTTFAFLPPQYFGPTALFKSTNEGHSWVRSDSGLPSGIADLVADPQHPSTLYVLGGVTVSFDYITGDRLFKSQDAGKSWAEIWSTTTAAISVGTLAVAPQDPNILYVGINSSIARSVDGGHTWTVSQAALKQAPGACCVSAIAVDPQNSNIVYAGTSDEWDGGAGVWKSTDGGVNWVNLVPQGGVGSIIIDPGNLSTIYVNGGAWTSTDGGQTWTIKSYNVGAGAGCRLLAIDPHNSSILYCGDYGTNVFRSVDAGATWTKVGPGLSGSVSSLTLDPRDPGTLYATTSRGLFAITLTPSPLMGR